MDSDYPFGISKLIKMAHTNLQWKILTTLPGVYCGQIYLMVNCLFYWLAAIYNMYKIWFDEIGRNIEKNGSYDDLGFTFINTD